MLTLPLVALAIATALLTFGIIRLRRSQPGPVRKSSHFGAPEITRVRNPR